MPKRSTMRLDPLPGRMSRIRVGAQLPEKRQPRAGADWFFWGLCALVAVAWFSWVYRPEKVHQEEARAQAGALHERSKRLLDHCLKLERELEALAADDPRAWEQLARGRLGWCAPAEQVELKPPGTATEPPPPPNDPARRPSRRNQRTNRPVAVR